MSGGTISYKSNLLIASATLSYATFPFLLSSSSSSSSVSTISLSTKNS